MSIRTSIFAIAACAGLTACASSPYLNSPNWLNESNSPVWTAGERADFVDSITPGETTLGEVTAMYGPSMSAPTVSRGDVLISELIWYGKTGLDQPWAAIQIPGHHEAWNDATPVLSVYNSEGARKTAGGAASASDPDRMTEAGTPAQMAPAQPAKKEKDNAVISSTAALADGRIGPDDVTDSLAAEMAAFGESGADPAAFRARFGPEAEYDEDRRFFRKFSSTLFYGSEYDNGPNIWIKFDSDDTYYSTMIHIPRSGNQGPYRRFF